jgi:colanic acid/amylovoran biosynthesis protein
MLNIHIKGGDYSNFGDRLMLETLIQQLRLSTKNNRLSVENYYCDFSVRSQYGLELLLWQRNLFRFSGVVAYPIIKRYSKTLGVMLRESVQAILDISGFAYTDYWGPNNTINMAHYAERQHKNGATIVLLPQAYGPFNTSEIKDAILKLASHTSMIYTRDNESYKNLTAVGINEESIRFSPDVTTISPYSLPQWTKNFPPYACIIPNSRVFEQDSVLKSNYLQLLADTAKLIAQKNIKPLFLLFEKRDKSLVKQISNITDIELFVSPSEDPVELKGIISKANFVVGSRYHSLVSALSQGVPSIGTSWAHKYEELFKDYQSDQYLLKDLRNDDLMGLVHEMLNHFDNL